MVDVQPLEPCGLLRVGPVPPRPRTDRRVVVEVAVAQRRLLIREAQVLQVDQTVERIEHPPRGKRAAGADRLDRAQVERAREDGEASPQRPLVVGCKVVAPVQRGPQGPLLRRCRAVPGAEHAEAVAEAIQQLLVPALALLLAVVAFGRPDTTTGWATVIGNGLLVQTLISLLIINLWEETAWMGFVQARLQVRHGAMLAAVLTAPLFALEHLPLLFTPGQGTLLMLAVVLVLAVPMRIACGWLYNRTSSIFVVGLFTGAVTQGL